MIIKIKRAILNHIVIGIVNQVGALLNGGSSVEGLKCCKYCFEAKTKKAQQTWIHFFQAKRG